MILSMPNYTLIGGHWHETSSEKSRRDVLLARMN